MRNPIFNKEKYIESNLRVNHAGEYGAKRIYTGQIDYSKNPNEKELINHMREQELVHLKFFENELPKRNIRPSILYPIWHFGGYFMGSITSIVGIKYAMICTEAVEEVIDSHYQNQLDNLNRYSSEEDLVKNIKLFQNDEIEHKEIAEKYTSNLNIPQKITYNIISYICKTAITLAKRL